VQSLVKGLTPDCDGIAAVSAEALRDCVGCLGLEVYIVTVNPADPIAERAFF